MPGQAATPPSDIEWSWERPPGTTFLRERTVDNPWCDGQALKTGRSVVSLAGGRITGCKFESPPIPLACRWRRARCSALVSHHTPRALFDHTGLLPR